MSNGAGFNVFLSYQLRRSFWRTGLSFGYNRSNITTLSTASQSYFQYINDNGGIDGSVVEYYRDQTTPTETECFGDGSFYGASGAYVRTICTSRSSSSLAAQSMLSKVSSNPSASRTKMPAADAHSATAAANEAVSDSATGSATPKTK